MIFLFFSIKGGGRWGGGKDTVVIRTIGVRRLTFNFSIFLS